MTRTAYLLRCCLVAEFELLHAEEQDPSVVEELVVELQAALVDLLAAQVRATRERLEASDARA